MCVSNLKRGREKQKKKIQMYIISKCWYSASEIKYLAKNLQNNFGQLIIHYILSNDYNN